MADARARGWGDPDEKGYRARHIVGITAGGQRLYVRKEVAALFQGFLDEIVRRGYRLDEQDDDWGYINRDIRGRAGVKSNHAWGLAIDINSAKNPMTEDGRVHTDMPPWVESVAARWGLAWGGAYSGKRKDPMHFEYLGKRSDVRVPVEQGAVAAPVNAPTTEDEEVLLLWL